MKSLGWSGSNRSRPECWSANSLTSHAGDEPIHAFVDGAEGVLAQHGPLCLVVELEVHPVDGEVATPFLSTADELAAQPGPGGLRRDRLRREHVEVTADAVDGAALLHQREQATATADVVVREVELGHARVGQRQVVPVAVALDQA